MTTANTIPTWFRDHAVYQINPRTFSAEGTIAAVTKEIPKLYDLGFRILYLCPVFEEDPSEDLANWSNRQKASETGNPKNPYRMNDYFKIDDEYGTMDDLAAFVAECHKRDMRVLLDLVYLHIGPNAPIIKTHPEFAQHNEDGSVRCTYWRFPYLNFENAGLREYLWCNMTYYIGALDVDGFRCDVGDGVPEDFWQEGRRRIQAIKPDAVLINEGSKYQWLATAFDSCYNFPWHEEVYKCLSGTNTAAGLVQAEKERLAKVPEGGYLLRDMDNHDTVTDWPERAEKRAGHDGMEAIMVLNYCMVGIPMVYCGNELADTTYMSMFANRFHMGKFSVTDRAALYETEAGKRRMAVVTALNQLLAAHDGIHGSKIEWLDNDCPERVVSFRRPGEKRSAVLYCNLFPEEAELKLAGEGETLLSHYAEVSGETLRLGGYGYLLMEE